MSGHGHGAWDQALGTDLSVSPQSPALCLHWLLLLHELAQRSRANFRGSCGLAFSRATAGSLPFPPPVAAGSSQVCFPTWTGSALHLRDLLGCCHTQVQVLSTVCAPRLTPMMALGTS